MADKIPNITELAVSSPNPHFIMWNSHPPDWSLSEPLQASVGKAGLVHFVFIF